MVFQNPVWIHSNNAYKVCPNVKSSFFFTTTVKYENNLDFPNTNNDELLKETEHIANIIVSEGKDWFASPIKVETFLEKVTHTFSRGNFLIYKYGNTYMETYKLKQLWIHSKKFELEWVCIENQEVENSIIPSDFLNFTEIEPSRTIIIQPSIETDLVEQNEIEFDSSEQLEDNSSRTMLKDKIKNTRKKIALAQMKLNQLEKKYFRLYGFDSNDESDSSISDIEDIDS